MTIGIVPQEIALYEDLTARQNLAFWGRMYDMGGKTLKARDELANLLEPETVVSPTSARQQVDNNEIAAILCSYALLFFTTGVIRFHAE